MRDPLVAEYATLRHEPGHMQQTHGPWNAAVDGASGRKVQVMKELLERVRAPGTSRDAVVATFGEPDMVPAADDVLWSYIRRDPGPELLIYTWRGTHDFIWFLVRDGRVLEADWWLAGE